MDTNKTYMIVLLGLILSTSFIQTAFAVHKPYWSPSTVNVGPEYMEYHLIIYGIDTTFSNGVIQACVQISNANSNVSTINGVLTIEIGNATEYHKACNHVDINREIKEVGMYKTFDAGYFIFPASMAPDKGELNGCIKIHGVTSCSYMGHGNDTGILKLDMHDAYDILADSTD